MTIGYLRVSDGLRINRDSGREKLRRERVCRMCARPSAELEELWHRPDAVRILTRHHLVPKRFFKHFPEWKHLRDCDGNVVPLCRPDHDLIHSRDGAVRLQARAMLRRSLTQEEIAYMVQVRGIEWVNNKYPLHPYTS